MFIEKTDEEAETPILWSPDSKNWLIGKDSECWEWLKAAGEGDNEEWDGWMASTTLWTWIWAGSRSWWWIGKLSVLKSTELQRIGHGRVSELNMFSYLFPFLCIFMSAGTFLSYSLLYFQYSQQSLSHTRCWINMCWINEQMNLIYKKW